MIFVPLTRVFMENAISLIDEFFIKLIELDK